MTTVTSYEFIVGRTMNYLWAIDNNITLSANSRVVVRSHDL